MRSRSSSEGSGQCRKSRNDLMPPETLCFRISLSDRKRNVVLTDDRLHAVILLVANGGSELNETEKWADFDPKLQRISWHVLAYIGTM